MAGVVPLGGWTAAEPDPADPAVPEPAAAWCAAGWLDPADRTRLRPATPATTMRMVRSRRRRPAGAGERSGAGSAPRALAGVVIHPLTLCATFAVLPLACDPSCLPQ